MDKGSMTRRDFLSKDGDDLRWRKSEPRIHPSAELKECRLGRSTEIGPRCLLRDVALGDYSYFERAGEATHATIGKFCSIASSVRINALAHPLDRVTTHKISYRPNEYFRFHGVEEGTRAARAAARVTIGNDVWVGHGAVVMPGVEIGDGAVIGAGSVVTRDVGPYEIVAGAPARRLRLRLGPALGERLRALAWWDWPPERLFDAIPDMQSMSVDEFLAKWETPATPPIGPDGS